MTLHVPALIAGAGISGLVCAYALRKAGVEAVILEATARPGGVIRSERRDGYLAELGPQSFSGSPALRKLCTELGVQGDVVEAPARAPRYVLIDRVLRQVPLSPPALLRSSLVGAGTKLRILRDLLGRSRPPDSDESIANFVRRKFSGELLDRLAGPFVSGVYAGDPEKLSVRSAFPQVYEAERSAGSVIRGLKRQAKSGNHNQQSPTLASFRNGLEILIRGLVDELGPAVRTRTGVTRVEAKREQDRPVFELQILGVRGESTVIADHFIVATPTDMAGRLLRDVNPSFEALLRSVEYAPVAIVALGYKRADVGNPLKGFGFLVPRSAGLRVLGCVWNSSLFPDRAPEGHVLLTSFLGGVIDPKAVAETPLDLTAMVHREIGPLLSISQMPAFSNVQLYPRALPQYNIGHADRLAAIEKLRAEVPNLWLAGNYLRGPAIGACVEQSLAVAEEVLAAIKAQ
jgi:protoporphyrinogen/coproporphyrinogen III oxidase